jgi:hypothetical protein
MPFYEYRRRDGSTVTHLRSWANREIPGLERIEIPTRHSVRCGWAEDPGSARAQAMRGYRNAELKGEFGRRNYKGYSAKEIKRIWAT